MAASGWQAGMGEGFTFGGRGACLVLCSRKRIGCWQVMILLTAAVNPLANCGAAAYR